MTIRTYLTKEFFLSLWSIALLDTWQVQSVYWIVVEKILPLVCVIEIVSCPKCEKTKVKAFLMPYLVTLLYPTHGICAYSKSNKRTTSSTPWNHHACKGYKTKP